MPTTEFPYKPHKAESTATSVGAVCDNNRTFRTAEKIKEIQIKCHTSRHGIWHYRQHYSAFSKIYECP